ncbi:MAG: sulfotransferase family protein, partial [Hyphomicrobiales bacterium]
SSNSLKEIMEPVAPFFILGAPRSGTTLLRDLLRQRPDLICPEETMYYRWHSAFGSPEYNAVAIRNMVLKKHRALDGIGEAEFQAAVEASADRRELMERHIALYRAKLKAPQGSWFDKSPHNVYGLPLLAAEFPEARFVHIHRHPVEVAASAAAGRQLSKHSLAAAVNVWLEPMTIFEQMKPLIGTRLVEFPYGELARAPERALAELESRLGLEPFQYRTTHVRAEKGPENFRSLFGSEDIAYVERRCAKYMRAYGYGPAAAGADGGP